MNQLQERTTSLAQKLVVLEALNQDREDRWTRLRGEILRLSTEVELLTKVEHVLLMLGQRVLGQSTTTIDQLVTAGLRLVFEDQRLEFRTHVDKYRGKTSVEFELLEDGKRAPIMDSYGGGVLVTAGLLLRTTTIIVLGLRRILLLDETLSHLSDQYVPNASQLMKKLCEELDFTIILVSHQPEFATHADTHYRASRKNGTTTFERLN